MLATTVYVTVEVLDYSTVVGDGTPTIKKVGPTLQFMEEYWLDALDAAYKWIKDNREPQWIIHVLM